MSEEVENPGDDTVREQLVGRLAATERSLRRTLAVAAVAVAVSLLAVPAYLDRGRQIGNLERLMQSERQEKSETVRFFVAGLEGACRIIRSVSQANDDVFEDFLLRYCDLDPEGPIPDEREPTFD